MVEEDLGQMMNQLAEGTKKTKWTVRKGLKILEEG